MLRESGSFVTSRAENQNCGQDGHISRDCPQEQGRTVSFAMPTGSKLMGQCYQCGQVGHISANCPSAATTDAPAE